MKIVCDLCATVFFLRFEDKDGEAEYCPACGEELPRDLTMTDWPDEDGLEDDDE